MSRINTENYSRSEINIYNFVMEYQRIINLLDNTPNQPSKFEKAKIESK